MLLGKRKINNSAEYSQLFDMLSEAREAIITGSARSGSHYSLMHQLSHTYKIRTNSREEAMQKAQELLEQWERDNSSGGLSDREFDLLSKADEW